MDASQRGRAGKIAESSVDAHGNSASELAQRTLAGEPNGDQRASEPTTIRAVENRIAGQGVETAGAPLGRLVENASNDIANASPDTATRILEIDAEDWIDKDLEALSATDETRAAGATAPRPTPSAATRRLPFPMLRFDERLGRILLSIVLAVLLWFYVVNLENPTNIRRFTGLTIEVRNAAPQLKLVDQLPTVDASVQGPQNLLDPVSRSDIHPYIDLTGISEGGHDLPILNDLDPARRRDLTITFSPSKAHAQLELQETQVLTISAQINGTPAIGYKLEPAQVTPGQLRITGLKDAVSRIAKVIAPVDVEGKASTQQGSKTPIALDSNGQEITGLLFDPPTVQVVAPIKLLLNYKVVPVKVPLEGQPASGYQVSSINIDPTNVTVCCSPNLVEQIQFLEANPVSITGTTSTVITFTTLILPPGIELYFDQPKQITVTVSVAPIETTLRLSVAPTVEGLDPGYNAVVSPNQIDLTLAGTFSQLQSLSPAAVRALINAQGRGAGTYTVKPQITLPQGVKLESSSPDQLTLTLIAPTPAPTQTPIPQPTATPTVEVTPTATPALTRTTVAATPTTSPTTALTRTTAGTTQTASATPAQAIAPTLTVTPQATRAPEPATPTPTAGQP